MSVASISDYLYVGLSSDTKPKMGVVNGAKFIETDTDQAWIYSDGWYQIDRVGISLAHKMIHMGKSYHIDYNIDDDTPLAKNASIELWLSVPNNIAPHLAAYFWCEEAGQCYIYENPTVSAEGTVLTPINRNRNSSNTTVVVKHTPTVTDNGTVLLNGRWINGEAINAVSRGRGEREIIYKSNNTYLFRLTARDDNVRAGIELDWYEK